MVNIIIIYSTIDGHTIKICSRLRAVLEEHGNQVTVIAIDSINSIDAINDKETLDLTLFDKIVIGASIRYGKHNIKVYEFIKQHAQLLDDKPSAFFSVNLVARKPEKNQPETNPYVAKFLTQIAWKPNRVAVFAGKIDYQKYTRFDRFMIRFIMWMTKGPTDLTANIEFTNWNRVDEFGQTISKM